MAVLDIARKHYCIVCCIWWPKEGQVVEHYVARGSRLMCNVVEVAWLIAIAMSFSLYGLVLFDRIADELGSCRRFSE
jgi:hypothetical protein